MHRRRSTVAVQVAILATLVATALMAPAVSAAPADHDPILLVHGYRGDPSTWADMKAFLEANDRLVETIDLATEDNVKNAQAISAFITAKGWTRVDLVGQSMGGLSARHFTKAIRAKVVVDSYTSLGTPQYGILSACLLPVTYGGQMCPSSSFLGTLNKRDDTPGNTAWTTIYSTNDEIVPNSASRLDGGACFIQVSGPSHNDMDNDANVMAHVLASVDRTCTGVFR
jgi:triacylglycerol lipase